MVCALCIHFPDVVARCFCFAPRLLCIFLGADSTSWKFSEKPGFICWRFLYYTLPEHVSVFMLSDGENTAGSWKNQNRRLFFYRFCHHASPEKLKSGRSWAKLDNSSGLWGADWTGVQTSHMKAFRSFLFYHYKWLEHRACKRTKRCC